jgi:hypothetical protein
LTTESGATDVLSHPWFKGITLEEIEAKTLTPYPPYLKQTEKECIEQMSTKERRLMENFNLNLKAQLKVTAHLVCILTNMFLTICL